MEPPALLLYVTLKWLEYYFIYFLFTYCKKKTIQTCSQRWDFLSFCVIINVQNVDLKTFLKTRFTFLCKCKLMQKLKNYSRKYGSNEYGRARPDECQYRLTIIFFHCHGQRLLLSSTILGLQRTIRTLWMCAFKDNCAKKVPCPYHMATSVCGQMHTLVSKPAYF